VTGGLWILAIELPRAAGPLFADALSDMTNGLSCFESQGGACWRIEALFDGPPERAALEARLALAAAGSGIALPASKLAPLPVRDWLALNRKQFPPVAAGRFLVYGSYHTKPLPPGAIGILLDAGLAFGSGTHETTRGCLLAIERLARRRRFRRPLDLGTGSGILAIAMAKRWRRRVLAADIDPVAVRVAQANARRNGVGPTVRTVQSTGLQARALRRGGPYDLITANILARPLERMARDLACALAPGGRAVLSGMLVAQQPGVLAAYRAQGLRLAGRVRLGGWATLILAK